MKHKRETLSVTCVAVGKGGIEVLKSARAYLRNFPNLKTRCVALDSDSDTLENSQADETMQVGKKITYGLGCHGEERLAVQIAEASEEVFEKLSENCDLLCLFCGLGGGTGSVLAPKIAQAARPSKALRVSICSLPFDFESTRIRTALLSLTQLQEHCHITVSLPLEDLIDPKSKEIKSARSLFRQGQLKMLDAFRCLVDPLATDSGWQYWEKLRQLWGGTRGAYLFASVQLEDLTTSEERGVAALVEHLVEKSPLKDYSLSIEDLLICLQSDRTLKREAQVAISAQLRRNFVRLKRHLLEVMVDEESPNNLEIKVLGKLEADEPLLGDARTQKEFDFRRCGEFFNELNGEDLDEPTWLRRGVKIPFK